MGVTTQCRATVYETHRNRFPPSKDIWLVIITPLTGPSKVVSRNQLHKVVISSEA